MASPPPPPRPSRPVTLKLRTASASIVAAPPAATPSNMSPPPATPSGGGGGLKIIVKRSQPPTPAAIPDGIPQYPTTTTTAPVTPGVGAGALQPPPTPSGGATAASALQPSVTMTQKGRVSKPTAKKRARDFGGSDEENRPRARIAAAATASAHHHSRRDDGGGPPKRPKLILKKSGKAKTASIVLKQIHKEAPPRSRGEGYDSEEEDRELDPLIEEEFVLRMLPGAHCDYLRRMVEERKMGVPVKDGGADFQLRWLPGVERRALVTVQGAHFVGVLVDLPTITEGMKTWDRKNFMKSADICQMLLVFAAVPDEAAAKSAPLPAMVGKDYRWPHGLTPPMHDCIHRRFRKRLSKKEIKDKEAELQRLLNEDRLAVDTKWELFDDGRTGAAAAGAGAVGAAGDEYEDSEMAEDEDADGDIDEDYFGQSQPPPHGGQQRPDDADAEGEIDEAELMAEFMEEDDDGDDDGAKAGAAGKAEPGGAMAAAAAAAKAGGRSGAAAETPTDAEEEEENEDEEEDDNDNENDDDEDDEDDLDEDEQARAEQAKGVREDISELKKSLATLDSQLAATQNALLRKRIEGTRKRVLSELRLKQASIGEIDEEE